MSHWRPGYHFDESCRSKSLVPEQPKYLRLDEGEEAEILILHRNLAEAGSIFMHYVYNPKFKDPAAFDMRSVCRTFDVEGSGMQCRLCNETIRSNKILKRSWMLPLWVADRRKIAFNGEVWEDTVKWFPISNGNHKQFFETVLAYILSAGRPEGDSFGLQLKVKRLNKNAPRSGDFFIVQGYVPMDQFYPASLRATWYQQKMAQRGLQYTLEQAGKEYFKVPDASRVFAPSEIMENAVISYVREIRGAKFQQQGVPQVYSPPAPVPVGYATPAAQSPFGGQPPVPPPIPGAFPAAAAAVATNPLPPVPAPVQTVMVAPIQNAPIPAPAPAPIQNAPLSVASMAPIPNAPMVQNRPPAVVAPASAGVPQYAAPGVSALDAAVQHMGDLPPIEVPEKFSVAPIAPTLMVQSPAPVMSAPASPPPSVVRGMPNHQEIAKPLPVAAVASTVPVTGLSPLKPSVFEEPTDAAGMMAVMGAKAGGSTGFDGDVPGADSSGYKDFGKVEDPPPPAVEVKVEKKSRKKK